MASSEYPDASALFHYPKEYTSEKKAEQILDVSKLLKIFTDEFGLPSNHKTDKDPALYYNVAVSGGDTSYWKGHPSFLQIPLEVHFSKENKGHVVILFSNISNKWGNKSCRIWSTSQRSGAKERVVEIMTKMLNYVTTRDPKNTNKGIVSNLSGIKLINLIKLVLHLFVIVPFAYCLL